MAQQWPTTAPTVSPGTHDPVATQAYQAAGGDYFRSGYYSHGLFHAAAATSATLSQDVMFLRPFLVPVRRAFDRIGVNVTSAAIAGGVLRLGIYASSDGLPGALIVDGGTVSSTSTGAKEVVVAVTLDPGVYWLASVGQVQSCSVTAYNTSTTTPWSGFAATPPVGVGATGITRSSVIGALPDPAAATSLSNSVPAVSLRAA